MPTYNRPTTPEPARIRGRKLQERRKRVWSYSPCCATCKRLTAWPDGFELDHVVPLHKGGEDSDENCQVLCHEDHERKTALDMGYRIKVQTGLDGWPEGE